MSDVPSIRSRPTAAKMSTIPAGSKQPFEKELEKAWPELSILYDRNPADPGALENGAQRDLCR